jgi:hypothetical protein
MAASITLCTSLSSIGLSAALATASVAPVTKVV